MTASIVGGCETKFTVEHYPDFYKPSVGSVAVLPFENATYRKGAGELVAAHLSTALTGNGTYKVTGPLQLGETLKEKALPALNQNGYKQIAKELAGQGKYCQGIEFSPKQIAQSNGPGQYSAHFISMCSVVLTSHFKIK
jgi:hypothetical protein